MGVGAGDRGWQGASVIGIRRGIAGALCAAVAAIGMASPATAASANLLGAHGNFEKPKVAALALLFPPGDTFDGWSVSASTVSLGTAVGGVFVPAQGTQALILASAFGGGGGGEVGVVCRTIPTIAGHLYRVSFLAAALNPGSARVVAQLGSAVAKTPALPGAVPSVWDGRHATLSADTANASLCFTATKVSDGVFPAIDAVKVVDLGT
jgi:hypothetical protein